jgi:hypothetical protein
MGVIVRGRFSGLWFVIGAFFLHQFPHGYRYNAGARAIVLRFFPRGFPAQGIFHANPGEVFRVIFPPGPGRPACDAAERLQVRYFQIFRQIKGLAKTAPDLSFRAFYFFGRMLPFLVQGFPGWSFVPGNESSHGFHRPLSSPPSF